MRQIAFREELRHSMQAKLSGGSLRAHLGESAEPFFSDPNARMARVALEMRGYESATPGQQAAELGVRLMEPGRYRELDLNLNQARGLAARYARALRGKYGHSEAQPLASEIVAAFRRKP